MNEEALKRDQKKTWERLYYGKGPLWRGPPDLEVQAPLGERVLELGCGNGKSMQVLSSASLLVGIDYSPMALGACSKRKELGEAHLVLGDVRTLPFIDNAFDSIFCIHVLEHLLAADRGMAAGEIWRVLRSGGNLMIRVFSVGDMRASKGNLVEHGTRVRRDGIIYHYFEEEELNLLFPSGDPLSERIISSDKRYQGEEYRRKIIELTVSKSF